MTLPYPSLRHITAIIALLAAWCGAQGAAHALLVGVSAYEQPTGWNKIHGAEDVRLLTPVLQQRGFSVTTVTDADASRAKVLTELERLARRAKEGDTVYVHFSCHGQPVEDLDGDEPDGWDEALVLYGAYKNHGTNGYKAENHLLDDDLAPCLARLRKAVGPKGMVYVVVDACHAGTASRGEKYVRGTNAGYCFSGKPTKYTVDKKKGQPSYYRLDPDEHSGHIVILEACRAWENNLEIRINQQHPALTKSMREGDRYGSLTYHVCSIIHNTDITKRHNWVDDVKRAMDQDPMLTTQVMVVESTLPMR